MILETLKFVLGTEDVAIYMRCYHTCQTLRGAESNGSMTTLAVSGKFKEDNSARSEFLALVRTE